MKNAMLCEAFKREALDFEKPLACNLRRGAWEMENILGNFVILTI